MRKISITIVFWVVLGLLADFALAYNDHVGTGRVPPGNEARERRGLIRSPNPIDNSGNLLITGNVGDGKHFRGVVPYSAPFDFRAPASSLSHTTQGFDYFLRDSSGGNDSDWRRYTGEMSPYYSSSMAAGIEPGKRHVMMPTYASASQGAASADSVTPEKFVSYPFRPSRANQQQELYYSQSRPMLMSLEQLENNVLVGIGDSQQGQQQAVDAKQQADKEKQFMERLTDIKQKAGELEKKIQQSQVELKPLFQTEPSRIVKNKTEKQKELQKAKEGRQLDIYDVMKQQLEELQRKTEQAALEQEPGKKETVQKEGDKGTEQQVDKNAEQKDSQKHYMDKLTEKGMMSAKAKTILGEHKTFASYSQDKFNQYLRAAEVYLKEGKYYLAADAYTLASLYKPGDPLADAGKSHALFASGDYMSSAMYLSKALDVFPDYAEFKIDLVGMIGDKDKVENRIADVNDWLKKSGAVELDFLLGYVYYQMDRIPEAKASVEEAYKKMPDSKAVAALKKVIDAAR